MARLLRPWLLSACAVITRGEFKHSAAYRCCRDTRVRVCLPSWGISPIFEYDSATGRHDGYIIDFLEVLASELGIEYVTVPSDRLLENSTLPVGCDVALLVRNWREVLPEVRNVIAVTAPIYESHFTGMVLVTESDPALFDLLDPFAADLWACIVALPLLTALAVALLEAIVPPPGERGGGERKPLGARRCRAAAARVAALVYHMAAALVGGDGYEWATWPGRVLRLGLLFVGLVVVSTYTANLAAFFNMPAVKIHGPDSMETLRRSRACVNNPNYVRDVAPFVSGTVAPPIEASRYNANFCHEQLREGRAAVWVEDLNVATSYWRHHCADLRVRLNLMFIPYAISLFAGIESHSLVANITVATLNFQSQPDYTTLRHRWFGVGGSLKCVEQDQVALTTKPIRMASLYGMFVIYGQVVLLALAIAVAQRAGGGRCPARRPEFPREVAI